MSDAGITIIFCVVLVLVGYAVGYQHRGQIIKGGARRIRCRLIKMSVRLDQQSSEIAAITSSLRERA